MKLLTSLQDPLHRRIVERLETLTDRDLFESCACSLLRPNHPGLVPVSGGNDAGMDGAIPDGEAEAFPLVVTTRRDFVRNLRDSLDAQARKPFPRHKAVFATSRRVSPAQREQLEEAARKRGVVLVDIVDQEGITELLYHSSRWREELGITGSASALSVIPKSRRRSLGSTLVGRERDLEWLRTTPGDRILSGQPGSGKTFLLRQLANEGSGLFVVQADDSAIKDAILDLHLDDTSEVAVIVDDAHASLEVIDTLRNLREQMGASFPILASCWPGSEEEVLLALAAGRSQVQQLELMTRAEISEVYASAGVSEEYLRAAYGHPPPELLLRRLIDQAAKKPGLAVTLASLVLKGEEEDVFTGRSLLRELRSFKALLGTDPTMTLAAFAAGGEAGMPLTAVADFRGVTPSEIQAEVIGLAAGGVLVDQEDGNLSVEPRLLRSVLLAETFFREGGTSLSIRPLIDVAPVLADAVVAMIWSLESGAQIEESSLLSLVARVDSERVWELFASTGPWAAEMAFHHYSGAFLNIAEATLKWIPRETITRLLSELGISVPVEDHDRARGKVFDLLERWLREFSESSAPLERRKVLLATASDFFADEGLGSAAAGAAFLALSPVVVGSCKDPGAGTEARLTAAHLPLDHLRSLADAFEKVLDRLPRIQPEWTQWIADALKPWILPGHFSLIPPGYFPKVAEGETKEFMQSFARRVLEVFSRLASGRTGLLAWLEKTSLNLAQPLQLAVDPDFRVLYPHPPFRGADLETFESGAAKEAKRLARNWLGRPMMSVASRIAELEREAVSVGWRWPRMVPPFCQGLAASADDPLAWVEALSQEGIEEGLVILFLRPAVEMKVPGWDLALERRLKNRLDSALTLELVLSLKRMPAPLLDAALLRSSTLPEVVGSTCRSGTVAVETLTKLLSHESQKVRVAAAIGEWYSDPSGQVRAELQAPLRQTLLAYEGPAEPGKDDYWISEILTSDDQLAFHWLRVRLEAQSRLDYWPFPEVTSTGLGLVRTVVRRLTSRQKVELLPALEAFHEQTEFGPWVREYVSDDVEVFGALLEREGLEEFHLDPLAVRPSNSWAEKVESAGQAGYSAREVAESTLAIPRGESRWISGSGVSYWQEWEDAFHAFLEDQRSFVRATAEEGVELSRKAKKQAQAKKRQRELTGYF